MKYYVYQLIDPRTDIVFYIGKGQKRRMYTHVNEVIRGRVPNGNDRLGNKIKKIINFELKVKYKKVLITDDEQEAYTTEKKLIKEIGLENLCNLTGGGEGGAPTGKKHHFFGKSLSKEHKKKLSEAHKGKKLSEEHKEKIGNSHKGNQYHKGKFHSDETKYKMSINRAGKNHPMFGKNHTSETKRKISDAKKGQIPWNKGKIGVYSEETLNKMRGPRKKK